MNSVRVLSHHASYRCRHAGACCTSGWPIPVERDTLRQLQHAIDERLVAHAAQPGQSPFVHLHDAPDETPALLATTGGKCVFYRPSAEGSCAIHDRLGHGALPLACRQFPRVSVIDPRGVSVTLSHYCPTAAALLETDAPLHIVTDAPAFPREGEYVGLDASRTLPPLLRPGVLMDWESWWEFGRLSVESISASRSRPSDIIDRLRSAVDDVRTWNPGDGELIARVRSAFARPTRVDDHSGTPALATFAALAVDAMPDDLKPLASWGEPCVVSPHAARGFIAAHAFANWAAHLGEGLRSWLRTIEIASGLVEAGFTLGRADLILRHLADPHALARVASRAERD